MMGVLRFYDQHPAPAQLLQEVVEGLRVTPRRLSPKFFYDERGSRLFNEICRLPEYYVTRTEMAILDACARDVARCMGEHHVMIELGCGASDKARVLLQAVRPLAYVPIDISRSSLLACAEQLLKENPAMDVHAICADYTRRIIIPSPVADAPRLVFFPGSTLGNFEPHEAEAFLRRLHPVVRADGALLIGVDAKKDRALLHRAYNDAQGVTADFNLNLLVRIRRELDAEVDITGFRHEAYYNEEAGRIEMYLVSRRAQSIIINGDRFAFEEGEGICTEYSYKYSHAEFRSLAMRAGYECECMWSDACGLFGVYLLRACGARNDYFFEDMRSAHCQDNVASVS